MSNQRFTPEIKEEAVRQIVAGLPRAGRAPGAGALEVLEKEPDVNLPFTDVGLPNGINGRQLADEVRRRWPAIKVLFTTGYKPSVVDNGVAGGSRCETDLEDVHSIRFGGQGQASARGGA